MASKRFFWRKQGEESSKRECEGADKAIWKSWVLTVRAAVVVLVVVLGGIYAYTRVWPPLVTAEGSSMQHGHATSHIGTIDTGDIVFVQAAPFRSDVITYLQGRATGYSTYGDYGDVIVFRLARDPTATPIVHRAIMYVLPNGTLANVPDLDGIPATQWQGYRNGLPVNGTAGLSAVTIEGMGYNQNLEIQFNLAGFMSSFGGQAGYVTMGDNNAYDDCTPTMNPCSRGYDTSWFPAQGDIVGHARGEIPWIGLVKLLLLPTATCAHGWADPCAPLNSWDDLALSLAALFILPFIIEGATWVWSTYAWPLVGPGLPRILGKVREAPQKGGALQPKQDVDHPGKRSSGP